MWSSLQPTGPFTVNDASRASDASASTVSVVSGTPPGFEHCSVAIQACAREIEQAPHLPTPTRSGALLLLSTLARQGRVNVTESPQARQEIGAVQWAMERTLPGTEVILTPDLPTPFRTYGKSNVAPAQAARAVALIDRFQRGDPLYMAFHHEGKASEEDNPVYSREVLRPAERANCPVYEIWLGGAKSEFPHELSGAFILSRTAQEPAIFAVLAAQVDKVRAGTPLRLFWAQEPSASGPGAGAVPSATGATTSSAPSLFRAHLHPDFAALLDDWSSYLAGKSQRPITQVIGKDAAMIRHE